MAKVLVFVIEEELVTDERSARGTGAGVVVMAVFVVGREDREEHGPNLLLHSEKGRDTEREEEAIRRRLEQRRENILSIL